jgi:hypothetical protein
MSNDGMSSLDHSLRFRWLNHARYEIWRHFFLDHKRQHPIVSARTIAGFRRLLISVKNYDRPPLP